MATRGADDFPRVVIVGVDPARAAMLEARVRQAAHIEAEVEVLMAPSRSPRDLLENRSRVRVAIVAASTLDTWEREGDELPAGIRILAWRDATADDARTASRGGGLGGTPRWEAEVFYLLDSELDSEGTTQIIAAALEAPQSLGPQFRDSSIAARVQRTLAAVQHIARQETREDAARLAERACLELTRSFRAHCCFYDARTGRLRGGEGEPNSRLAHSGVVGFVARTGRTVRIERAQSDSRYLRAIDDPAGKGDERFLAHPIADPKGIVLAVLVLVRRADDSPFGPAELETLDQFSRHCSTAFHQLELAIAARERMAGERDIQTDMYAGEALAARERRHRHGDVVRITPRWLDASYWMTWVALAACGIYLCLGRVQHHSSGPALVRGHARSELSAPSRGRLQSLEVASGDRVRAGQTLARFDASNEGAQHERLEAAFHQQLRRYMLRGEVDPAVASVLIDLRERLREAELRLEQRIIRAPHSGTVSDLRIREGQHLEAGDIVMSVVQDDREDEIIAFLPGRDRPRLSVGMPLRIELRGFAHTFQNLRIAEVGEQVIGPAEARRAIGPQLADTVHLTEPTVVVRARLPTRRFEVDGRRYRYREGMAAIARVATHREPIAIAVFPALAKLWRPNP